MLTDDVKNSIDRCVLCWLATADAEGRPNVSPKEIFVSEGDDHLLIANIASPKSLKNLETNREVCVSFVDVFVQKGYKLQGEATVIPRDHPDYAMVSNPLRVLTKDVFPILSVVRIRVTRVMPILAPSYRLVPGTTEESQIASAMAAYGVSPRR